jgi:hypothetical protein
LIVRVQINPASNNVTLPTCAESFIDDFQANLTSFVLDATHQITELSDFVIPSGLHLTYFSNDTSSRRRNLRSLTTAKTSAAKKTTCNACNSAGCALSCGFGICHLCSESRRRLERTREIENTMMLDDMMRRLDANWDQVGVAVTEYITPMVQSFLVGDSIQSFGCLGDPNQLVVNVTYLSDVAFDPALESALVTAFGAPTLPPTPVAAPSPNACCSQTFATCVKYCGTTPQQCNTCNDQSVVWLSQGPPPNSSKCVARWGTCTNNVSSCCAGLTCVGDVFWKGCVYVPPTTFTFAPSQKPTFAPIPNPTYAPTPKPSFSPTSKPSLPSRSKPSLPPTSKPSLFPASLAPTSIAVSLGCCSQSFATCVSYCGVSQQQCQSCTDPTVVWLPNGVPSNPSTCTPRWRTCTQNITSCCQGLTCVGNQWWKSCQYVP